MKIFAFTDFRESQGQDVFGIYDAPGMEPQGNVNTQNIGPQGGLNPQGNTSLGVANQKHGTLLSSTDLGIIDSNRDSEFSKTETITTFDCHIHTNRSDGLFTYSQAVQEAVKLNMNWVICTDHDVAGNEFTALARRAGINSFPGTEVSCKDDSRNIHCLVYASEFDGIFEGRLRKINKKRASNTVIKLLKFKSLGFNCDVDGFISYWIENKVNAHLVGNQHIVRYLFPEGEKYRERREYNEKVYTRFTTEPYNTKNFIQRHMLANGDLPFGYVPVRSDKPSLEEIAEIQKKHPTPLVRSLAHPNETYAQLGPIGFADHAMRLIRSGLIDGIEIGPRMDPAWVESIKFVRNATKCLITHGSDCHFVPPRNGKRQHEWLGVLHSDIAANEKEVHFNELLDGIKYKD